MKLLGIKLTLQMEKSNSDAEHGETRVLQQYSLHRLRIEVEDCEHYLDTMACYMDEDTINDMRQKELKPNYVVDIVVGQPAKKKKKTPAVDPSSVKWVFRMGDDGQAKSDPEHLPIWYVLRAHYVECVCLRAHLSNVQENNGRVTLKGLDSVVPMKERLTFIRTHLAHTVELVEYVLVAHWHDLENVAENITFEVCKKAGKKRTMWIDDGSKTLHISVTSADTAPPDIDAFVLQRLREQIEGSEQMKETVTDLRERTEEFAKKLGEELGGDMTVGKIQEDDVIAGLSRESLRYLCPPSAILATSIVYQLPYMDRNVARACVGSSANQPSTLVWKWHIKVATNNTPDYLRCLRFWIESEGFTDTQKRDRLLVMRDYRGKIKAHVNPQDVDDELVLGRWESFSLVECVGSKGRHTAQRVDFVSCMGVMYRTTRGVEDFVEHLPNVLNVGWEAKDKSVAELDALRGDVLVYANDHFRRPPLLYGPVLQAFNVKDHRLEIATHLLLEKLANIERHLTAYTFCKVNIAWTSWSRFAKNDGLERLAIFTLLTTVDRLEAAVDINMGQLEEPVEGPTEDTDHKSPYFFFQNVTIHFDYDPSILENTEKQVAEASPWTLVKSGPSLIVSCKKVIFEDESEIADISGQAQRYADIGTYEECPFFRGLQSLTDTVKNDQLKHALGQKMTRLAKGLAMDNVSLTLSATVPSLSTPNKFGVLHHPNLPGDVMAQYSSRLGEAMKPFIDAVSFISASGAEDSLQQINSVEVVLPHADDTRRTYGITFQNGVLQYTLPTPSHHTKSLLPSRYMLIDAILFALKIKPKSSDKQTRDISAQETSVSEQSRHSLQVPLLGSQNVFSLELRNIQGDLLSQAKPVNDGDITVSVLHDSETIACESSLQDQTNGVVCMAWTPPYGNDVAGCLVDVRWRGDPVKGSPFPAALIPPDESRHRALGRGRLVGQADGFIQAGSTWHQLVYHRPHGCRSLTELGQFVRKKETEQSGRRMTPAKFVSKHHQWTHLHRNGWQVTRHPALHVYHHQVGLDAQSTSPEEGVKSTEQQRPVTSKQRPMTSSLMPSFSMTELADDHFLLRCRPAQVGTFETRMQCPVCREELQTVSTTHSLLQTARVIVMPGRISARTSYVEGSCLEVV